MLTSEQWVANFSKLIELINKTSKEQTQFYQNILLLSSGLLGLLSLIHSTQSSSLYIRLILALSLLLLLLNTLLVLVVLYDYSRLTEQLKDKLLAELRRVLQSGDKPSPVTVNKRKRTVFCEKWSLILLASSLLLLVVYTLLSLFIGELKYIISAIPLYL